MSDLEKAFNEVVKSRTKSGVDIIREISPQKAHLAHMAMGVSGESGELLDAIKKHVMYDKVLDYENVVEELGDLEFYMQGLRDALGITRAQTLQHNVFKLTKRYPTGSFSNDDAQERKDKTQDQTTNQMKEI